MIAPGSVPNSRRAEAKRWLVDGCVQTTRGFQVVTGSPFGIADMGSWTFIGESAGKL
jgi:hypothetical protein